MPEPTASSAAGAAAVLAKLGGLLGAGVVGALLVAAVDPAEALPDPKARRRLIALQVIVAGVVSTLCTKIVVRWLDATFDFIDLRGGGFDEWAEVALPVALLLGALSWGLLGAVVKLRALVRERGADAVADTIGLDDQEARS